MAQELMSTEEYFNLLAYYASDEVDEEKLEKEIEAKGGVDMFIRTFINDINNYRPLPLMHFTIRSSDAGRNVGIVYGKNWKAIVNAIKELVAKYWDFELIGLGVSESYWNNIVAFDEVELDIIYKGDDDNEVRKIEIQRVYSYGDINK